jgi:carboxyl-terminal processing protease
VVLVNGETSGGAELIAAVLQDNLRARVVGQRTRGKATVQRLLDFQRRFDFRGDPAGGEPPVAIPGLGMKLSGGVLIRPSGRNFNRFPDSKPADDWGVRPDPGLEVRVSPELNRRLREWWLLQSLRPGTSDEGLPLDDPLADPQREAALQALLETLPPER